MTAPTKRTWHRPPQQNTPGEILHSNERPDLTAVFGTPHRPRGLSGVLRRRAFKRSESKLMHWMLLLAADRIDVIEGLGRDLMRGRVPNVFKEMGMGAEYRLDRKKFYKKVGIMAGAVGAVSVVAWLLKRR